MMKRVMSHVLTPRFQQNNVASLKWAESESSKIYNFNLA